LVSTAESERSHGCAALLAKVLNELNLKGSYCGHEEYPSAIDFIANKRVDVKSLI